MARRPVLKIGDPRLRQVARDVEPDEVGSLALRRLVDDMIETMRAEDGIGLAAPQIGEPLKLAVVEFEEESPRYPGMGSVAATVFINPAVTILDQAEQAFWEGCLSVPELRGVVHRPRAIRVDYLDVNGTPCAIEADGFVATVLQHELDHLQGVLYVDRMRDMRTLTTLDEYRRFWADQPVPEFE